MKLLSTIFVLALANMAVAQSTDTPAAGQPCLIATHRFEIGISGGYLFNTLPVASSDQKNNVVTNVYPAYRHATGSLNVQYNTNKYSFGASASVMNLSYWINY